METADAVMVAHKDKVRDVKNIVAKLNPVRSPSEVCSIVAYIARGATKVSMLAAVSVGQTHFSLNLAPNSLQMHHHRAEHWIVVSGTARGGVRR